MIIIVAYYNGVLEPVTYKGNLVVEYGFSSEIVDAMVDMIELYPEVIYMEMSFEDLFPGIGTD